jgi:hypothetical protein
VQLTRGQDESEHDRRMIAITLLFAQLGGCFNSGRKLNPVLRHHCNVLQQR